MEKKHVLRIEAVRGIFSALEANFATSEAMGEPMCPVSVPVTDGGQGHSTDLMEDD